MAASGAVALTPGTALGLVQPGTTKSENQTVSEWPQDVREVAIPVWDTGVFITELVNQKMLPKKIEGLTESDKAAVRQNVEVIIPMAKEVAPPALEEGTYRGTQLALTKVYDLIEKRYSSFMDTANFEPTVPSQLSLEQKKKFFAFTYPNKSMNDYYPPHLNLAANKPADAYQSGPYQKSGLSSGEIFSTMRLAQLTTLLPAVVPDTFLERVAVKIGQTAAEALYGDMGTPDQGQTIADVEQYNKTQRERWFNSIHNDIFDLPNVGDLADWYTDRRFAQQHFTGTNPTTIEVASDFWVRHFTDAATEPADQAMKKKITDIASRAKGSLYVQDCSYLRKSAGIGETDIISSPFTEKYKDDEGKTRTVMGHRYGVASVCLFHLTDDGQLEPLAIVIDWRGSAKNSVTIYNKELNNTDQANDWPWRYAKTCVQSSDWIRHEMTVHLTNTHLIEEATIVGAQRSFENNHRVFQLLYPHWQKTLALNAAARETLVPHVIIPLCGFEADRAYEFIISEYEAFDFKGRYVPEDLRRRGFPPEELDSKKYHNYAYARCIYRMWGKIRSYVEEMLKMTYKNDAQVAADHYIKDWVTQMRADPAKENGGAGIKSFPVIKTLDELIDAVTMCIHIASPQHTAVNYLQNYYQSFVINKPPSLYRPPPTTRAELDGYVERDLVAALPMNHTQDWLLASHIPYLLSFKPGDKESLIIYAASKYHVYKGKPAPEDKAVADAAARFYEKLAVSDLEFKNIGKDTDDSGVIQYDVLSPSWNAVSILI